MTDQQSADWQAKEFLYDLQNKANESGFKSAKKWNLILVSPAEKIAIEKNFHAAVTTKASPEILAVMFNLVQTGLGHFSTDPIEVKEINQNNWQYLVAYNPELEKR